MTLDDLECDSVIFYAMFREKLASTLSIEIMTLTLKVTVTQKHDKVEIKC